MQSIVVIARVFFGLELYEFSSNFENIETFLVRSPGHHEYGCFKQLPASPYVTRAEDITYAPFCQSIVMEYGLRN